MDESVNAQLYLILCNPMDYSWSGFSVYGILQARILEWIAIAFSRRSSQPRNRTCVSYISCINKQILYHMSHQGSPMEILMGSFYKTLYHCFISYNVIKHYNIKHYKTLKSLKK